MPQSFSKMLVHIIFSTKDRHPYFNSIEMRNEMHKYLGGLFNTLESQVIIVNGPADHVHIYCMLSRKHSVSQIIMDVKKESSRWMKTKGSEYTKFSWQRGYAAFTVGESQSDVLVKYIENQEEHHKKQTFYDEYKAFLKKYNIPYDERYMWD